MKIDKIKCDICGDLVDYNNIPVNREWSNENVQKFKINKITLNGIREVPTTDQFNKKRLAPVFINMEYDLCEKCLKKFYVLINKIKEEGDVK